MLGCAAVTVVFFVISFIEARTDIMGKALHDISKKNDKEIYSNWKEIDTGTQQDIVVGF